MLTRLARVMRAGGELRFATDIDDNAGWTLARILRSPHFGWRARAAQDWREPWPGWAATRYEAKALRPDAARLFHLRAAMIRPYTGRSAAGPRHAP